MEHRAKKATNRPGTSEPDSWYPYPLVNASHAQQDTPPPKRLRKSLTALGAGWCMRRGVRILRLNCVSSHDITDKTTKDGFCEKDFLVSALCLYDNSSDKTENMARNSSSTLCY